jgi:peptidyl-prolyl cis-trans isomerase SurA
MFYKKVSLLIFALSCLGQGLNAQTNDPALAQLGNGIAAIAEGEIITIEQVRRRIAPMVPSIQVNATSAQDFSKKIEDISKDILQDMIDQILIVRAAEDEGMLIPQSYIDQEYDEIISRDFRGDRARFLEFLKTQNQTPREFRREVYKRFVVRVMRQQNRKSQSEISPERIEDFYVNNKIRFYQNESVRLRQIILTPIADESITPLRQTAKKIMTDLDSGLNFSDLARQYSQGEMSRRGGDWGWIERQDIRSELSQVAFDLEPGEYSDPIELSGTIFILYSEDKRQEMIQPITQVREVIEEVLIGEIARETQERWLQQLRDNAYIRYFI